ncbi:MAG: hypothetical protein ABMB14_23965 [Myxococcota bacterium]
MIRTLWIVAPVALVACSGGDDGEQNPGDPCLESGAICTWLGVPGEARVDGEGTDRLKTHLYLPVDVEFAPDGTAYYPDYNNHRVRRISTDGVVDTVTGTGFLGDGPNVLGSASNCWGGCNALDSAWNHPTGIAVNPENPDELWIAAWHNSRVNVVDLATNTMTWYAGTGARNYSPGVDTEIDEDTSGLNELWMDLPSAVGFGPDGTVYYTDQANHMIRGIRPDGTPVDVSGTPRHAGFSGDGGPAADAQLHGYTDQKADPGSKMVIDGSLMYIADTVNGVIRLIDLDAMTIDTVAGKYESLGETEYVDAITGIAYTADKGSKPGFSGDGGDALEAVFNTPRDVAVGIDGEVYIADTKNNCIRVLNTDGTVDTFAGQCGTEGAWGGDEGPAVDAQFSDPFGVAVDPEGNVYVSDTENQVIRRIQH